MQEVSSRPSAADCAHPFLFKAAALSAVGSSYGAEAMPASDTRSLPSCFPGRESSSLQRLGQKSLYLQTFIMVGATGIEPVTPTMST
jgi:hypothetical protein